MANQTSRLTIAISSARAKANADSLTKSLKNTTQAGTQAANSATALASKYKSLAIAASGYLGLTRLVTDISELETINTRLARLSGNLAAEQFVLKAAADDLGISYRGLAQSAAEIYALEQNGLLIRRESRDLLTGFAAISKVAAVNSAQLGQSLFGLSQALASNVVISQDFRQVVSPIPVLMGDLDKAAGLTAGGFRQLVAEGKVTSEFFKNTLIKALEKYEEQARTTPRTIRGSLIELENQYTASIAKYEEPISITVQTFTDAAIGSLKFLDDRIESTGITLDKLKAAWERNRLGVAAFATSVEDAREELTLLQRIGEAGLTGLQAILNPRESIDNIFDPEKTSEAIDLLEKYNKGLFTSTEELKEQATVLLELQEIRLATLRTGDVDFRDLAGAEDLAAALSQSEGIVVSIKRLLNSLTQEAVDNANATSDEWENLFNGIASTGGRALLTLEEIQAQFDKFVPSEKQKAALKLFASDLQASLDAGELDQETFNKFNSAIQAKINKLEGFDAKAKETQRQAELLRSALEDALPELGRERLYVEQVDRLRQGFLEGKVEAGLFNQAIANLAAELKDETFAQAEEAISDLNNALTRNIDSPYRDIVTDIVLLEQAALDTPQKIDDINLALANIDRRVDIEFTVVDGNTEGQLAQSYKEQVDALRSIQALRGTAPDVAQDQVLRLAQDFSDKLREAYDVARDEIVDFLQNIPSIDAGGIELEIEYKAAVEQASLLTDADEKAEALLAIEKSYQDQLSEVVRSGEFTREQFRQAAYNDQLAGIQERYQQEFDLTESALNAFFSVRENREQRQTDALARIADDDEKRLLEARRAFQRSGTEENAIALRQAEERFAISEEAAKKQFEQQKQASIAMAKLQAGVAVMNALATGPNFFVGLAQAGIALYTTRDVIEGIKSQQYQGTGGGYSISGGQGAGGSSTFNVSDNVVTAQEREQTTIINVINTGFLGFTDTDDVISDSVKRLNENGLLADKDGNPLDTSNIQTREYTIQ